MCSLSVIRRGKPRIGARKTRILFSTRAGISMLGVAAYTHSRLHIETRGFAANFHVGTAFAGEAYTGEDVKSTKTSKFKTGTAISDNLVPGGNASNINP